MEYYLLTPIRPCDIWTYSTVNESYGKKEFVELVFAFDWLPENDHLYSGVSIYFVTTKAGEILTKENLSGIDLKNVNTIKSETFNDMYPDIDYIPQVQQMVIYGEFPVDDFCIQHKSYLVVSEKALNILKKIGIENCEIEAYDSNYKPPSSLEELIKSIKK